MFCLLKNWILAQAKQLTQFVKKISFVIFPKNEHIISYIATEYLEQDADVSQERKCNLHLRRKKPK